jgi:hypothetical protein
MPATRVGVDVAARRRKEEGRDGRSGTGEGGGRQGASWPRRWLAKALGGMGFSWDFGGVFFLRFRAADEGCAHLVAGIACIGRE